MNKAFTLVHSPAFDRDGQLGKGKSLSGGAGQWVNAFFQNQLDLADICLCIDIG
jgi:hypothetical protein